MVLGSCSGGATYMYVAIINSFPLIVYCSLGSFGNALMLLDEIMVGHSFQPLIRVWKLSDWWSGSFGDRCRPSYQLGGEYRLGFGVEDS